MKRLVVVMTVWTMAVAGVLAGIVFPSAASAAAPTGAGAYGSVAPTRLLDTRTGVGAAKAAVAPMGTVALQVTGRGGVPATASAVVLNVTVAHPAKAGFITAFGAGKARPGVSNLNFLANQTVANLVVAPVGVGGKVNLFNGSAGGTFLVADVTGYYLSGAPTNAGAFGSVAPVRMLDTRIGTGATKAAVPSKGTVDLQIVNRGGVPVGASAVVLNVTATGSTTNGAITVFGQGTTRPGTSNVNFARGQTVPNLVIAPVSASGKVSLFNDSLGSTSVIADAFGYFKGGAPITTGAYGSVVPKRLLDTRNGTGIPSNLSAAVAENGLVNLKVTGNGVPANASAVVLNVTATQPAQAGFITVFSADNAKPTSSNLNFLAHQTVPNLVIAPVSVDGRVTLFNGSTGATHLLADVSGYFMNDNAPGVDVTAPGPVTDLTAEAGDGVGNAITLRWTNPTDADFTGVMIRRSEGAIAPATITDGTLVTDLTNDPVSYVVDSVGVNRGTEYSYSLFAHDALGNYSDAVSVTYKTMGIPQDLTAPAAVTALTAAALSATSIKLAWTNPADLDFTGVIIRRSAGVSAPGYGTGTLVTDTASATATSFIDDSVTAGPWSYAVFSHDAAGNHAAAVNVENVIAGAVKPVAVLSFTTDAEFFDFDASASTADPNLALVSGTLDYGDGTALEPLSDEFGWFASHSYAAPGDYPVTLTVTDSAGVSDTTTVPVHVSPAAVAPTAEITIAGNPTGAVAVGAPVAFTLTTTGSAISSWTVWEENLGFFGADNGTPPASVTHTFAAAGTYTVNFDFSNDTGGFAQASVVVTVS